MHNFTNENSKKLDEYMRLFNLSFDMLCIHDSNGILLDVNSAWEKTLGYTIDELLGKDVRTLHHPEHLETSDEIRSRVMDGFSLNNIELKFLCKDGNYKWIQWNIYPSVEHNLVYAVGRDITKEKNMKEEIERLTEDYETIFNSTQDSIFLIDIKEGNQFYYRRLNAPAQKAVGVVAEDIIGKTPKEVFGEENGTIIENHYIECINKGSKINYEQSETHIKDNKIWNTILYPVFSDDKIVNLVGSSYDITEKKQIKQLQKKADEKIRALNESIHYENLRSEFFSNISHELRTPLNVIFGALQLVQLYSDSNPNLSKDDKLNRYLKVMKQNCFRLLRLINNLIDITKIDSGYFEISLENNNVVNVVEDICLSVAEYIENKSIEFVFDTSVEEKIIALDSDKIERVMLNLLSNSIKFTNPGGKITVNLSEEVDMFVISVKDTGTGIPEDKLKLIFDRFRQVDKSLARNHEGSGIGLALVKSLVEMHKGSVLVKSSFGHGSEFIIKLPITLTSNDLNTTVENAYADSNSVERITIEFSDIYS